MKHTYISCCKIIMKISCCKIIMNTFSSKWAHLNTASGCFGSKHHPSFTAACGSITHSQHRSSLPSMCSSHTQPCDICHNCPLFCFSCSFSALGTAFSSPSAAAPVWVLTLAPSTVWLLLSCGQSKVHLRVAL